LFLAALCLLSLGPTVLLHARRGATGTVLAIFVIGAWFVRGWQPPRIAIAGALLVGALAVNSVGEIRHLEANVDTTTTLRNLFSISYWDNISRLPAYELRNAAMYMRAIDKTSSFNFGASIWNAFVGEYVPGQLVGFDLKQWLHIGPRGDLIAREQFGYVGSTGATPTGLADSFQMFWYLGFVIFLAISAVMKRIFMRASSGDLSSQVIYICCISSALQSVTHYSTHVITFLPLIVAMVWLVQRIGVGPRQSGPWRAISST
jgi:hypothetical protein